MVLKHEEITGKIIKAFFRVYNELGYGFNEKVYERAMVMVLREEGVNFRTQAVLPVHFLGEIVGEFILDLVVEEEVVVELKAVSCLNESHEGQLINYLKASDLEVGLLLNFGPEPQIRRMIFEDKRKRPSVSRMK